LCGQAHAESKLEGLEDAVRRLKAQNDELTRQNQDLNNWKARLTQENYELQRQVQELDSSNGNLAKARAALQQQLDEAKARLDEESRVSCFCASAAAGIMSSSCPSVCACVRACPGYRGRTTNWLRREPHSSSSSMKAGRRVAGQ